mmetsp:Transcript_12460/g.35195  ORF Transcript_12460/g.35195 Transcript_12460/m.35195 type:complete len:213 (-) Transcript_12460:51-689(-)
MLLAYELYELEGRDRVEWGLPLQQSPQDVREPIHVDLLRIDVGVKHFRGDVNRGPHSFRHVQRQHARDSKVAHRHLPVLVHEQIGRLEVTVNEAKGVEVGHPRRCVVRHSEYLRQGELYVGVVDDIVQGAPLVEATDQHWACSEGRRQATHDVGVVQDAHERHLRLELPEVLTQTLREDLLHGVHLVPPDALPHLPHGPPPDDAVELHLVHI